MTFGHLKKCLHLDDNLIILPLTQRILITGEGQIMSKDRTKVIASYLKRIKQSGLQIQEFFEKYAVPFGVAQYYRYKKRFEHDGLQGLRDGRAQGNHRRLNSEAASFLLGFHAANPN